MAHEQHKELIQIIKALKPKRYLEIGVALGVNLLNDNAPHQVGIDPTPRVDKEFRTKIYKDTSDNVFASVEFKKKETSFDFVFIDGYHEFMQVIRDIKNSLLLLNKNGVIVCHDVYPFDNLNTFKHLIDDKCPGNKLAWTGDVWKTIFYVRYCMPHLQFYTLSNFPGYLYIQRSFNYRQTEHKLISIDEIKNLPIEYGINNKDEMHIVSVEELIKNVG